MTEMSPMEQKEVLDEIALGLAAELPEGWQRLVMDYMAIGHHVCVRSGVMMDSGSVVPFTPPTYLAPLFHRLRQGMYTPGLGTWYSMELLLNPPAAYQVSYNRDQEPPFPEPPTADDYALEQQWFPREERELPSWMRSRLTGA